MHFDILNRVAHEVSQTDGQKRPILAIAADVANAFITHTLAKTLVQAFISCRLDYCNALLYGITHNLIRRLQSIQNAAVRLLMGTGDAVVSHQFCHTCTGCQ